MNDIVWVKCISIVCGLASKSALVCSNVSD